MRRVLLGLGVGVLLLVLTACNTTRWGIFHPGEEKQPLPKEAPTAAQLVAYMNENSRRLKSVRCDSLDLTASQGIAFSVGLQGKMFCEQPRSFALRAGPGSTTEIELGSNSDEFWYWIKRGDPYQVHCAYKDLEEGKVRKMPFPFQPDWIMETLGMSTYGAPEHYQLVVKGDTLELVEHVRSPQGTPARKVVVFNRRPVQPPYPQVTDYLLLDEATGKEICSAHVMQTQMDPGKGGLYPRKLELRWPAQRVRLTMEMQRSAANVEFGPNFPAFVRRPLNGIPSIDLASGHIDGQPGSLQRAGFTNNR